jgi:hypothetical protein
MLKDQHSTASDLYRGKRAQGLRKEFDKPQTKTHRIRVWAEPMLEMFSGLDSHALFSFPRKLVCPVRLRCLAHPPEL